MHYLLNPYNILRAGWKIWLSSGLYLSKEFVQGEEKEHLPKSYLSLELFSQCVVLYIKYFWMTIWGQLENIVIMKAETDLKFTYFLNCWKWTRLFLQVILKPNGPKNFWCCKVILILNVFSRSTWWLFLPSLISFLFLWR